MTHLKLDFDRAQCPRLVKRLGWVLRQFGMTAQTLEYTRTTRGWHVEVTVPARLRPVEVVALQAILGSDRNREVFNLVRARLIEAGGIPQYWQDRFNVLFDRKVIVGNGVTGLVRQDAPGRFPATQDKEQQMSRNRSMEDFASQSLSQYLAGQPGDRTVLTIKRVTEEEMKRDRQPGQTRTVVVIIFAEYPYKYYVNNAGLEILFEKLGSDLDAWEDGEQKVPLIRVRGVKNQQTEEKEDKFHVAPAKEWKSMLAAAPKAKGAR